MNYNYMLFYGILKRITLSVPVLSVKLKVKLHETVSHSLNNNTRTGYRQA